MIKWIKNKMRGPTLNAKEAYELTKISKVKKEIKDCEDLLEDLDGRIRKASERGLDSIGLSDYNFTIFEKNEDKCMEYFKSRGFSVEKELNPSTYGTTLTYTGSSSGGGFFSTPPTDRYIIKWGDKQTIFNNEMKDVIKE